MALPRRPGGTTLLISRKAGGAGAHGAHGGRRLRAPLPALVAEPPHALHVGRRRLRGNKARSQSGLEFRQKIDGVTVKERAHRSTKSAHW